MVFAAELIRDFNLFPALLAASVGALLVSVLLMRRSILTEKLARRGQHVTCEYSIDLFEYMRVCDVMDREVATVPADLLVTELSDRIANGDSVLTRRQGTLIVDAQQQLAGIITRGDLVRSLRQPQSGLMTVAEAGSSSSLVVTYPDEPLHDALTKMLNRDIGRLPVVDRSNPSRIVGYLGRAAILSSRMKLHDEETIRQRG